MSSVCKEKVHYLIFELLSLEADENKNKDQFKIAYLRKVN